MELMFAFHSLIRHEHNRVLRAAYLAYLNQVLFPLTHGRRAPIFDSIYLAAMNLPDAPTSAVDGGTESMRGRISAILAQYRDPPAPFGKPAPAASLGTCVNDASPYGTAYDRCNKMRNPLTDALKEIYEKHIRPDHEIENLHFDAAAGIWPLGPGVLPLMNLAVAAPHALHGWNPANDTTAEGTMEPSGDDYLLSYWFARYHGTLAAP
jgi:hypothetical protein